ncbi:MAG: hypothetical protein ACK4WN_09235 [Aphanizomenon sp.]
MKHFSIVSLSACALVIAVPFINPVTGIALISQSTSALAQNNNQNQPLELKLSAKKQVISQDKQGKQIKTWESLQSNTVSPGDILQYTLTGINNGNKPIPNVTLNPLIPKQMVYVLNSIKVSNQDAKVTYSIDNQRTFVEKPTVKVTRNGKIVTEPAPAKAYTHIRVLIPSIQSKETFTAVYETQVR